MGRRRGPVDCVVLAALALTAPALGLAAELPGAAPAAALPTAGVLGEDAAGVAVPPTDQTRFGVAAGIGETDNVNLTSSHPQSQTLSAADLDFALTRTGSRLDASALGDFTDIDYLQGAYSNQVLGRFDGLALAKLWSDRLKWIVREDYGDAQIDPFAAITPSNLERENLFTTGPDLTLRPSDATFVELEALYGRSSYETSPFDANIGTGSVAVGRQLSALSSLSLVGQVQELKFDNTTVNTDYDRRELYGRYQIQGARTQVEAELGVTQANDVGSWETTPLARLSLARQVSPFSSITLDGGREYTDGAGSFSDLRAGAAGGITIGAVTQTTANYLRNYASAGWVFSRLRTSFGLTGTWERDTYDQDDTFDVNRAEVEANLGRHITQTISADITAGVERDQYPNQGFADKYGTAGGGLTWRPGRWVEVYARYDHAFRSTSGPASAIGLGGGYDENRVFVMVGYRPHTAADEAGGNMGLLPAAPPN